MAAISEVYKSRLTKRVFRTLATSSSIDDKFTVYVQKNCYVGPYLDPNKVQNLPDFYQERSVIQTVKRIIADIVLTGFKTKEVTHKVPMGVEKGQTFEVVFDEQSGNSYHYNWPVLDRKSKGNDFIKRFVENLESCPGFLSQNKSICKECQGNVDLQKKVTVPNLDPTFKVVNKETASTSLSKAKSSFTVYCRKNCKTGPLLNPKKVRKLSSFSGAFPKVVQELVPAIILCGYKPFDVLKRVPSTQSGCILIKVNIGKVERMCLVGKVDCLIKFNSFIKRFCSALGMCKNFFSPIPSNQACERCRNYEDDYSSSDDDDFEKLKTYRTKRIRTKRRKPCGITFDEHTSGQTTPVKKFKAYEDTYQLHCKEFKVVVEKLPQETVDHYLQKLPGTPFKNQLKKVYLDGKKVSVIVPEPTKSPHKRLFPEAFIQTSGTTEDQGVEAENLLNRNNQNTESHSDETSMGISVENDHDNDLLETFLDEGVHDTSAELMSLKEISENIADNITDRNPLQGLFGKSEDKRVDDDATELEEEEDSNTTRYSSPYDASQLYSPDSFFGDVLSFGETGASPKGVEINGVEDKALESEVSTSNEMELAGTTSLAVEETNQNKTKSDCLLKVEKERSCKSKEALKNSALKQDQSTDLNKNYESGALEPPQSEEGCSSAINEKPNWSRVSSPSKESENDNLLVSGDCFTSENISVSGVDEVEIPLPRGNENQQPSSAVASLNHMPLNHSVLHNRSCSIPSSSSFDYGSRGVLTTSQPQPLVSSNSSTISLQVPDTELLTRNSGSSACGAVPLASLGITPSSSISNQGFGRVLTSSGFPQVQGQSVENFRVGALTSSFGSPHVSRHSDSLSGMQSAQGPFLSLPGNIPNSGFPIAHGTMRTPPQIAPPVSVPGAFPGTFPGTFPANSISPVEHGFKSMPSPITPSALTGNFTPYPSLPIQHGTNNILTTRTPVPLPGNVTNQWHMNMYGQYSTSEQQLRHFTFGRNGFLNSTQHSPRVPIPFQNPNQPAMREVGKAVQQAREVLWQKTSQTNIALPAETNQNMTTGNQFGHSGANGNIETRQNYTSPEQQLQSVISTQTIIGFNSLGPPYQSLPNNPQRILENVHPPQFPNTRYYPPYTTGNPTSSRPVPANNQPAQLPITRNCPPTTTVPPDDSVITILKDAVVSKRYHSSMMTGVQSVQPLPTTGPYTPPTSLSPVSREIPSSTNRHSVDNNKGEYPTANRKQLNNPLAKSIFALLQRCQNFSESKQGSIQKIIEEMLRNRRQRLPIQQKDINNLEVLVGDEIKNEPEFPNMIKLLTREPVLENGRSGNDLQGLQNIPLTARNGGSMPSVVGTEGATSVMQSHDRDRRETSAVPSLQNHPTEKERELADQSGNVQSNDNSISSRANPEVENVTDQPTNKQSISSTNKFTAPKFDDSLPRPRVQVSKIEDMVVLLWDLPDQTDTKVIKEYELYAIQLEADQQLTKEIIRSMTWRKIGVVKSLPPPMAITLTNLVAGLKSYMVVRVVGTDGRFGPFSHLSEVKLS